MGPWLIIINMVILTNMQERGVLGQNHHDMESKEEHPPEEHHSKPHDSGHGAPSPDKPKVPEVQDPEGLILLRQPGGYNQGLLHAIQVQDQIFGYSSGQDRFFPNLRPHNQASPPVQTTQHNGDDRTDTLTLLDRYLNGGLQSGRVDPRLQAFYHSQMLNQLDYYRRNYPGPNFYPDFGIPPEYGYPPSNFGYDQPLPPRAYPPRPVYSRGPVVRVNRVLKVKGDNDGVQKVILGGSEAKGRGELVSVLVGDGYYNGVPTYRDAGYRNVQMYNVPLPYNSYPPIFYYMGGGVCP